MGETLMCPFFARFSNGPNLGPFVSPTKKNSHSHYSTYDTLWWLSDPFHLGKLAFLQQKKGRGLIYWSETQVGIEYLLCITKEARGYLWSDQKIVVLNWCTYSQLSHLIYYKLFSSLEQGTLIRQKGISTIAET